MLHFIIINGPNLNLLGKREPQIYGTTSFETHFEVLRNTFPDIQLTYFQSNHEGALIDCIHLHGFHADGIIINAGGYTHTSIALADAIKAVPAPTVEVHISNIYTREAFRHHSYLKAVCKASVTGLGLDGYRLAIAYLKDRAMQQNKQA